MVYLINGGDEKTCKEYVVRGFAFLFMAILVVAGIYGALEAVVNKGGGSTKIVLSKGNYATTARELLTSTTDGNNQNYNTGDMWLNRVAMGSQCSKDNILVFQGATSPLPNGIPTYTVEIENVCLSGISCSISEIHLTCGWFSSARFINPRIFRRIGYDDCLVNDGKPLNPGDALSFQYANTFKYPLSVSSVSC